MQAWPAGMTAMHSNSKKIDTIIWDLDQTLYKYWDGLPESFSEYTGKSVVLLAQKHHGLTVDVDEAVGLALRSYRECGLTTTLPAQQYGLDEVELYRHHHSALWDDYARDQWGRAGIESDIRQNFAHLAQRNIRSVILTHGTTEWGQNVTEKMGIRTQFNAICGIDDLGLRLKSRDASLFADFMAQSGIKPVHGNDYANVMIVEDTPANLVIPKRDFNMHTVLLKTERVKPDFTALMVTDRVVNNISDIRKFMLS